MMLGIKFGCKILGKKALSFSESILQVDVVSAMEEGTSPEDGSAAIKSAVLVTAEHAFCDGQSLSYLCHQLLELLSATPRPNSLEAKAAATATGANRICIWGPSFETACQDPRPPAASPADGFRMAGLMKFPRPTNVGVFPVSRSDLNAWQLSEFGSTYKEYVTLTAEESNLLLQQCRKAGTTITGALGAVMLQAAADVIGSVNSDSTSSPITVSLSCAADTRKLYSPPMGIDVIAYHVAGVPIFARDLTPNDLPGASSQLWETAIQFKRTIEEAIAVEYPLATAGFMGQVWSSYLDKTAIPAA